jgi:TrmH family RNA methyltransferase
MSLKNIKKLTEKKYRHETLLFMVEGEKNIRELLASDFTIVELLGTRAFLNVIESEVLAYEVKIQDRIELTNYTEAQLVSMGTFMTNSAGIAIAKQKDETPLETILATAKNDFVVVLDDIRDPGNLGTIIRTAEWFGVTHIIASPSTVDFYNSKVITASMGSFTRMSVTYTDLEEVLRQAKTLALPILTADMDGKSVHHATLPKNGLLVMGSESHGVSLLAKNYATDTVAIPRFGNAESLNVSVATGILLDSLKRT